MSDEDLRGAFAALRERDRSAAPPFGAMHERAERRARTRKTRNAAIVAFAVAALVLLAIWVARPSPEPPLALAEPSDTLSFLLAPPSASAVSARAPIDQIGEAW